MKLYNNRRLSAAYFVVISGRSRRRVYMDLIGLILARGKFEVTARTYGEKNLRSSENLQMCVANVGSVETR